MPEAREQVNGREKVDWHKFNHPKLVFAERLIPAGESAVIEQKELHVSRDMVIDYLAVSDDSISTDDPDVPITSPNQNFLHWVGINWGIVERASWLPIGFGSMEEFHNFFEGDRTNVPFTPGTKPPRGLDAWGPLRWRHSEPWLYNPIDTLSVDIAMPPPAKVGRTAPELDVFWDGVGLRSGMRRSFLIPNSPINAQANVPFTRSFSNQQLATNLGDEAFKMQAIGIGFPGGVWDVHGGDLRSLNFIRMRVVPSVGDSWSDHPVPLAFYGIHQAPPYRVALHKPAGGPIFLYAGQSIVFNLQNNALAANTGLKDDVDLNLQVCLIGRTAPGIGSRM